MGNTIYLNYILFSGTEKKKSKIWAFCKAFKQMILTYVLTYIKKKNLNSSSCFHNNEHASDYDDRIRFR